MWSEMRLERGPKGRAWEPGGAAAVLVLVMCPWAGYLTSSKLVPSMTAPRQRGQ